jgi:membrane associated rhomboid family serine protease
MDFVGWLYKLERKFGKYCIKNLMLYITALNGVVAILSYLDTEGTFISKLTLVPSLVMKGEVWRLVTFLFIPMTISPIWLLFTLYFYYMIGSSLEHEWGSFRFNVYYLIGVLGTIASAFILGTSTSSSLLNLSLIFAFAYLFPNFRMLIFFFFPVKIKYLAIVYAIFLLLNILASPVIGLVTILGSVLNFILFFGRDIIKGMKFNRKSYFNHKSFEAKKPKLIVLHRCTICGRTEMDDKNLDFRYCVDCDGDHEYCMDHLYTHEHIRETNE